MADGDFDPTQLSDSQKEALSTYTAVTNQEPSAAISLLERSQWNVQVSNMAFRQYPRLTDLADRYSQVLRR